MATSPEFSTLAVVLSAVLLAVLLVDPLVGTRVYDRLKRRTAHDSRALNRVYWRIMGLEWACAALVLLIVAASPGTNLADVGLALPSRLPAAVLPDEPAEVAGAAVGLLLVGAVLWLAFRAARRARVQVLDGHRSLLRANVDSFRAIIPRTPDERRLAAAVSVTAGICEELVYRGFLIAFGVGVLDLDPYVAAALAVVLFGVAHLYQGWLGMTRVTVFGIVMTALYLGTGSLVVPIVLHAVGDLASLVVVPGLSRPDRPDAHDEHAESATTPEVR